MIYDVPLHCYHLGSGLLLLLAALTITVWVLLPPQPLLLLLRHVILDLVWVGELFSASLVTPGLSACHFSVKETLREVHNLTKTTTGIQSLVQPALHCTTLTTTTTTTTTTSQSAQLQHAATADVATACQTKPSLRYYI